MKYRIKHRARGWAVQEQYAAWRMGSMADTPTMSGLAWRTIATYRWHWVAAFRLAWLREWARAK